MENETNEFGIKLARKKWHENVRNISTEDVESFLYVESLEYIEGKIFIRHHYEATENTVTLVMVNGSVGVIMHDIKVIIWWKLGWRLI